LGNVIDPFELVDKYGTDALRYYLLAEITPFEDGDFTIEKFEQRYNADLANGLGNLVSRVSNLLEKNEITLTPQPPLPWGEGELGKKVVVKLEQYEFNDALNILWDELRKQDEFLSNKAPWKLDDKEQIKIILAETAQTILIIAQLLQPFLPDTSEKIIKQFSAKQIKKGEGLFPRV